VRVIAGAIKDLETDAVGLALVVAVLAAGVGMILGGRLDARLEREEDEPGE